MLFSIYSAMTDWIFLSSYFMKYLTLIVFKLSFMSRSLWSEQPQTLICAEVHLLSVSCSSLQTVAQRGKHRLPHSPSSSSSAEIALPIPVPPPVTTATLLLNKPGLKTLDAAMFVSSPRSAEEEHDTSPPAGRFTAAGVFGVELLPSSGI